MLIFYDASYLLLLKDELLQGILKMLLQGTFQPFLGRIVSRNAENAVFVLEYPENDAETLFYCVDCGILREKFVFGCRSEESQDVEELEKRLASLRRI